MGNNERMSTEAGISQREADFQAALEHALTGKPLDPEIDRRIREGAAEVREALKKRGQTNVAVELIREIRDQ